MHFADQIFNYLMDKKSVLSWILNYRIYIPRFYFLNIIEHIEILQHIAFDSLLDRLDIVLVSLVMLIMGNIKELILRIHILIAYDK